MKSLTKKELSEELQHVYKQLADIKEDYSDDQKREYFEFIERNGLSYLYAFIFKCISLTNTG